VTLERRIILVSGILKENLPVVSKAPSTVEITYYRIKDSENLLIHLFNMTTNQRLYPDSVNEIFPVHGIVLHIKGGKKASMLNGSILNTSVRNSELVIEIPELKVIESLIVEY
jgi:hypothetical protein